MSISGTYLTMQPPHVDGFRVLVDGDGSMVLLHPSGLHIAIDTDADLPPDAHDAIAIALRHAVAAGVRGRRDIEITKHDDGSFTAALRTGA